MMIYLPINLLIFNAFGLQIAAQSLLALRLYNMENSYPILTDDIIGKSQIAVTSEYFAIQAVFSNAVGICFYVDSSLYTYTLSSIFAWMGSDSRKVPYAMRLANRRNITLQIRIATSNNDYSCSATSSLLMQTTVINYDPPTGLFNATLYDLSDELRPKLLSSKISNGQALSVTSSKISLKPTVYRSFANLKCYRDSSLVSDLYYQAGVPLYCNGHDGYVPRPMFWIVKGNQLLTMQHLSPSDNIASLQMNLTYTGVATSTPLLDLSKIGSTYLRSVSLFEGTASALQFSTTIRGSGNINFSVTRSHYAIVVNSLPTEYITYMLLSTRKSYTAREFPHIISFNDRDKITGIPMSSSTEKLYVTRRTATGILINDFYVVVEIPASQYHTSMRGVKVRNPADGATMDLINSTIVTWGSLIFDTEFAYPVQCQSWTIERVLTDSLNARQYSTVSEGSVLSSSTFPLAVSSAVITKWMPPFPGLYRLRLIVAPASDLFDQNHCETADIEEYLTEFSWEPSNVVQEGLTLYLHDEAYLGSYEYPPGKYAALGTGIYVTAETRVSYGIICFTYPSGVIWPPIKIQAGNTRVRSNYISVNGASGRTLAAAWYGGDNCTGAPIASQTIKFSGMPMFSDLIQVVDMSIKSSSKLPSFEVIQNVSVSTSTVVVNRPAVNLRLRLYDDTHFTSCLAGDLGSFTPGIFQGYSYMRYDNVGLFPSEIMLVVGRDYRLQIEKRNSPGCQGTILQTFQITLRYDPTATISSTPISSKPYQVAFLDDNNFENTISSTATATPATSPTDFDARSESELVKLVKEKVVYIALIAGMLVLFCICVVGILCSSKHSYDETSESKHNLAGSQNVSLTAPHDTSYSSAEVLHES